MSAFGPKAAEVAGRIGDGYAGVAPEVGLVEAYRSAGGTGPAVAGAKCCWGPDDAEARRLVHPRWPNMGLPGEVAQILPTTAHMEQTSRLVTEEMVADPIPTGPDPEPYVTSLRQYGEAGYDVVFVHSIGEDQEGFLRFIAEEVRPHLS